MAQPVCLILRLMSASVAKRLAREGYHASAWERCSGLSASRRSGSAKGWSMRDCCYLPRRLRPTITSLISTDQLGLSSST